MEQIFNEIDAFLKEDDAPNREAGLMCLMYQVTEQLKASNAGLESVPLVLRLIERHPITYFGSPGPLTHFIERFYKQDYEELLLKSIKRKPTIHTLLLLNRLINGADKHKATEYLEIMMKISQQPDIHHAIRHDAKYYLSYHE